MVTKTAMPIPYITIIIATFNAERTLDKAIASITNQSYQNFGLIIIDGNSTDNTINIIRKHNKSILYWISEPDTGIYNAWNKGLKQATGEWICFLGADDFLLNQNTLETLAYHLNNLPPSVELLYGQIELFTQEGIALYKTGAEIAEPRKEVQSLIRNIPHPGLMHRRKLFEKYGYFDETFTIAGDHEFLLRVVNDHNIKFVPNLVTVGMTQGGISSTPQNTLRQLKEVRASQEKHGVKYPSYPWLLAIAKVHIRVLLWKIAGEHFTKIVLDIGRRLTGKPVFWTKM